MIIEYLLIIALIEAMVYMAIKIAHAIFILVDSPEDDVQCREVSPEEFENVMKEIFGGEKDD